MCGELLGGVADVDLSGVGGEVTLRSSNKSGEGLGGPELSSSW